MFTELQKTDILAAKEVLLDNLIPFDNLFHVYIFNNSNVTVQKDILIQGKMLTVQFTMSQMEYESKALPSEFIKQKLAHELAELIINNHIDFTKMVDSNNFDYHFKARAFLVPNGDVQILRQSGY